MRFQYIYRKSGPKGGIFRESDTLKELIIRIIKNLIELLHLKFPPY